MPKLTDQFRAEVVAEYLRGTTTQAEVCATFLARTGRHLSPRTLRAWIARLGASSVVDLRARALLADALVQVRALEARLQMALAQLDGEAAAPMPVRHVEASNEPLPQTASSAGPVSASADPAGLQWAAAAALPLGIEEHATKDEPVSAKFSWD